MEQEERMGRQQIRSVAYVVGAVSLMEIPVTQANFLGEWDASGS